MDGDEVGEGQGAGEALALHPKLLGVGEHRQRAGDALVARPAHDRHGKGAATHASIGAGRRTGAGAAGDVVAARRQQRAAHLGSPGVLKALRRNGGVKLQLALERGARVRDVAVLDVVEDHVEREPGDRSRLGSVGTLLPRGLLSRDRAHEGACARAGVFHVGPGTGGGAQLIGGHAVARAAHHVRVMLRDRDLGHMAQRLGAHLDVEVGNALDKRHGNIALAPYQFARASDVRLGHALERLQRRRGVAAHGAQHRRRLDAAHAAGIGHRDALDVLDDIARAPHSELLGFATEHQARQRRRIRQRDRLRATQGADELAVQQLAQGKVALLNRHFAHALLRHGDLLIRISNAPSVANPRPPAPHQSPRLPDFSFQVRETGGDSALR